MRKRITSALLCLSILLGSLYITPMETQAASSKIGNLSWSDTASTYRVKMSDGNSTEKLNDFVNNGTTGFLIPASTLKANFDSYLQNFHPINNPIQTASNAAKLLFSKLVDLEEYQNVVGVNDKIVTYDGTNFDIRTLQYTPLEDTWYNSMAYGNTGALSKYNNQYATFNKNIKCVSLDKYETKNRTAQLLLLETILQAGLQSDTVNLVYYKDSNIASFDLDDILKSVFDGNKFSDKYIKNIPSNTPDLKDQDLQDFVVLLESYWEASGCPVNKDWKKFASDVHNAQNRALSDDVSQSTNDLPSSNNGSYEDWANVLTLKNLGIGPDEGNYDANMYTATNLFNSTTLSDEQKAQLATIPWLWTELGDRVSGDSTVDVPYGGTADYNKETIASKFESANANYGDFPEAVAGAKNARDEIETLMSANDSFSSDLRLSMLTYFDRVKFYAYNANIAASDDDNVKPIESDIIKQFYYHAGQTSGDSSLAYFYPTAETNKIAFNPSESGGMFKVKDVESYIRLYETALEIRAYATQSADDIQSAIDDGNDTKIKNWARALNNLKSGLEFLNSPQLDAIWKNSEITGIDKSLEDLYSELANSVGDLEDLGDLDATLETGRPLGQFFDLDEGVTSNYILQGVSYSTQYIPMRTNVYDQRTVAAYDSEFLKDFHYKYGFNRKALLIDESSDSAMQLHNTQAKGTTRVCTLRDLINCVGDITLYIDDNFYNAGELADLLGASYDKVTNTDNAENEEDAEGVVDYWWTKITENLSEAFDLDFKSQVKTAEDTQYSSALRNRVANFKDSGYIPDAKMEDSSNSTNESDDRSDDNKDNIVMTSGQINEYLNMEVMKRAEDDSYSAEVVIADYNVLQGYAVVSAVYRDGALFNLANSKALQTPVFIASKTVPNEQNSTQYERNEIFNWLLLKNLKSQMTVGYETSLDMDCPVYMDVYGNIVTESGVVVVPAAANATLFDGEYYDNIFAMALPYIYGGDFQLELEENGSYIDGTLSSCFEEDTNLGNWKVRSRTIDGDVVDFARLSVAEEGTLDTVTKAFNSYLAKGHYMYNKFVNISLEVMRGAPIEYIDKDYEGLNPVIRDKAGLLAAAKLEVLEDALDSNNENTVLSIPNLAFVDGVEYIALFAFKIMMFIVILVLMITLYTDMVGQHLSWRTPVKCIGFVALTVLSIVTIPTVFDVSYYESNRALLQDETEYIAMLNEEKVQNGVEIGVYDLREPDITSELYIKLDDIYVPWYDLFSDIMLSSTFNGIEEVYASYANDSPVAHQPDVTVMNDGVYVSLDDLFDSVSIDTDDETGMLIMNTDEKTTAAFYMPYYTILESLVEHVNSFNANYNWKGYTNTLQKGGRLKSMGLVEGYFTDVEFMEGQTDLLGMEEVYNIDASMETMDIWTDGEVTQMSRSAWYHKFATNEQMEKRFYLLSDEAREFVAKNRGIIGTISDETFLKVMALDLAMEHNKLFGVSSCNAIEIMNLSMDDTMRLMTGTRAQVMYDSTLSYPRYIYEIGGTVAVYMSAILSCINFVAGYIKPLCTALIMIVIFVSLFVFKVCLHKKSSSVYGYAITTLLLCALNVVYALTIKLSMYLPTLGVNPTICIIADIIIQLVYLALLLRVTYLSFKDWQDLGFARYQYQMSKMEVGANELKSIFKQKFHIFGKGKKNTSNTTSVSTRRYDTGRPEDNWKYYDELTENRKRRKKKYDIG